MIKRISKNLILFLALSFLSSCFGIITLVNTEDKAFGHYSEITKDRKSFGNKRLSSNKKYHSRAELGKFLKKNGNPEFIYEYEKDNSEDGIILYYLTKDSAFVFEETDISDSKSSKLKDARKIKESERPYLIKSLE